MDVVECRKVASYAAHKQVPKRITCNSGIYTAPVLEHHQSCDIFDNPHKDLKVTLNSFEGLRLTLTTVSRACITHE